MTTFARTLSVAELDALAAAPSIGLATLGHDHTLDAIAGYIVRRTVAAGEVLLRDRAGRVGYDIAVFPGASQYLAALRVAKGHRTGGSWAVVDSLWRCGCRS